MSSSDCPKCDRWISDLDGNGCELPDGQRWCLACAPAEALVLLANETAVADFDRYKDAGGVCSFAVWAARYGSDYATSESASPITADRIDEIATHFVLFRDGTVFQQYAEATDCAICPMLATDRDDALAEVEELRAEVAALRAELAKIAALSPVTEQLVGEVAGSAAGGLPGSVVEGVAGSAAGDPLGSVAVGGAVPASGTSPAPICGVRLGHLVCTDVPHPGSGVHSCVGDDGYAYSWIRAYPAASDCGCGFGASCRHLRGGGS